MKTLEIVSFTPELRSVFADLWVPWLKSMTGRDPEPEDLRAVVPMTAPSEMLVLARTEIVMGMALSEERNA